MVERRDHKIDERRLRPIYDLLDNYNYRKALGESDRLIRKDPTLLCAKALKALCYRRLQKNEECNDLLNELMNIDKALPLNAMQAMSMVYKELCQYENIVKLYEKAFDQLSCYQVEEKEEILTNLFMAYVRTNNYAKQQTTSSHLHRLVPSKNPYYYWSVMSLYLQYLDSELGGKPNPVFLKLAERYCEKYIENQKTESPSEMLIYLLILQKSKKYSRILDILDGPYADKVPNDKNRRTQLKVDMFIELECYVKVDTLYRVLLRENSNEWRYYLAYVDNLIKMIDTGKFVEVNNGDMLTPQPKENNSKNNIADHVFNLSRSFVYHQLESNSCGSQMLQIEIHRQLIGRPDIKMPSFCSDIDSLILQFIAKFGTNTSCYESMQRYVKYIVEPKEFLKHAFKGMDKKDEFTNENDLIYYINCVCFEYSIGNLGEKSEEELQTYIQHLLNIYKSSFFLDENSLVTDIKKGDTLIIIIVHLMMDLYFKKESISILWTSIQLLHSAIQRSSANFQFKLLQIRLFCLMGCSKESIQIQDQIPFKHIQLDSLGFFVLNDAMKSVSMQHLGNLHSKMSEYFLGNCRDIADNNINSYKNGNFMQILEFREFNRMSSTSLTYESLVIQTRLNKILQYCDMNNKFREMTGLTGKSQNDLECKDTVEESPFDPRQINLLTSLRGDDLENIDLVKRISYDEEVLFNKHQNALVQCVTSACDNNAEDLRLKLDEFIKYSNTPVETFSKALIWLPPRTRIHSYKRVKAVDIISDIFETVIYVRKIIDCEFEYNNEDSNKVILSLNEKFIKLLKRATEEDEDRHIMEGLPINGTISNILTAVEVFNYMVMMSALINIWLKTSKGEFSRDLKRKKIKEMPEIFVTIDQMVSTLVDSSSILTYQIDSNLSENLTMPESFINVLEDNVKKTLWAKINRRCYLPKSELMRIVYNKSEFLKKIK